MAKKPSDKQGWAWIGVKKSEYDKLKAELEQCRKQVKSLEKSHKAWNDLLRDIFGRHV